MGLDCMKDNCREKAGWRGRPWESREGFPNPALNPATLPWFQLFSQRFKAAHSSNLRALSGFPSQGPCWKLHFPAGLAKRLANKVTETP